MKPTQPKIAMAYALAIALLLAFFTPDSSLAEAPKIDLAEAKAELAKAKAEAQAASEKKAEKTPRKRLFGRGDKKDEVKQAAPPEKKSTPELKEPKPETAEAKKGRKGFGRLFGGDKSEAKKQEPAKEAPKETEKDSDKKRFALFGRDRDKDNKEKPEPKLAKTDLKKDEAKPETKDKDGDERRRLIGGMFAKDRSKDKEVEEPKVKEPKSDDGGSLFGFFRGDDSQKFAKAEKTKLGKSVESSPKPASGGALTKKSSSAGELGWYVVTEAATPFYAVGPGQPMPPEKILDRGSMLTVTKGGWGWCNVKLGGGELGVVSAKSMRPATVAEVSRHTTPMATASKSRGSRKLFNILSRGPAPELTLPTASDAPIRNFGLLPSLQPSD